MNYIVATLLALISTPILYILLVRNASSKYNLKSKTRHQICNTKLTKKLDKKVLKVSFIHPDLGIGKLIPESHVAYRSQRWGRKTRCGSGPKSPTARSSSANLHCLSRPKCWEMF